MSAKIDSVILKKVNMNIAENIEKKFELKIAMSVKIKPPKDEKSYDLALDISFNVNDAKNEIIDIDIESMFVFKLNSIPSNYQEFVTDNCVPIARSYLFDKIDSFLEEMGYEKLELSQAALN